MGSGAEPGQWGMQPGASLSVATFSTAGCRAPRNSRHPLGPRGGGRCSIVL